MFCNVMISKAADPEIWIRLISSRHSSIQVILDQEYDPELDDEWLTADEQLTRFRSKDQISDLLNDPNLLRNT